jgi:hypothetical protein
MVKLPDQHWTIPPLENGDSEALLRSADRLNRYEFERMVSRNISSGKSSIGKLVGSI